MKVLFAVNDENISTSIVKKYQKQYKEIISYKNVYYFNAILKELQKNKNYDRVVISEDLEEFTSSSLDQKDKFIFDRLDSISDEAVTSNGADIPIVLICSERRSKSEDILVKLFSIGIYNAILGEDRTIDEVCRLINKPRSKKEAKLYYKIDTENVGYENENDNDVSEVEMQNILIHFKKLGTNEARYAESFKNIVSQYNQEQLKVIIAVLPQNVKDVLEETSPEYRKIMKVTEKKQDESESGKKIRKPKKGTSEKLLETEKAPIMSKPVVVPKTMKENVYVQVDKKKKEEKDDLMELDDIIAEKPKKRGRPRKNPVPEEVAEEAENIIEEAKPKKRGRPRKNQIQEEQLSVLPGTYDVEEEDDEDIIQSTSSNNIKVRKEEEFTTLPGFDEDDNDEYDEDPIEEINDRHDEEDMYEDYGQITNSRESRFNRKSEIEVHSSNEEQMEKYDNEFEEGEIDSLLTGNKKVVAFIGTSKNGTSFIVNNVAQILSKMGIDTAILDATQNKNAYYIYTKNDEDLREIAIESMNSLISGNANGIKVNNNLTVYTSIPTQNDLIKNSHAIMETLIKKHSLVLIDCDFNTPMEYFGNAQELYLIQSMDVLTIQPLTEFLRELQLKGMLEEYKLRIILNKVLRLKRVNENTIIGGMSKYNNADLSLMKDLFNVKTVKVAASIPFDEDVYIKYLENMIECEINLNGYPKEMRAKLTNLAEIIYPLLPSGNTKQNKKKNKKGYNQYQNSFSSDMNDTLNNMRNRY